MQGDAGTGGDGDAARRKEAWSMETTRHFKTKRGRGVDANYKSQNPNDKWFDKLTTLSQVEGQIPITEIQNPKPVLVIEYWNLRFVCNLVLGIWDLGMQIVICFMICAFFLVPCALSRMPL